jgi:phage gp36-like protein
MKDQLLRASAIVLTLLFYAYGIAEHEYLFAIIELICCLVACYDLITNAFKDNTYILYEWKELDYE